jgi:dipeptidyl aminopeptidase/acylaminoacyl peptidase
MAATYFMRKLAACRGDCHAALNRAREAPDIRGKIMMKQLLLAASALALLSAEAAPSQAVAAPAATPAPAALADPAAAFGAREAVQQVSLSPNGTKVAFIAPGPGQSTILYTVDVAGGEPKMTLTADGQPERLTSCGWVSEARLVCNLYMIVDTAGALLPVTRVIAIDADGTNIKLLSRQVRQNDIDVSLAGGQVLDWMPTEDGAVLMGRNYVPQDQIGTRVLDKREGYGVDRIDTRTLKEKPVEPPKATAVEYITDGLGTVRVMGTRGSAGATGYSADEIQYTYRLKGSRDWKKLGILDLKTDQGFNPYAVDPALDLVYGFKKQADGRLALYSVALDGTGRETLVYANPKVDVDGLVRIGRNERVVGVTFATEKREALYFDERLAGLARSLSKALPGLPLIRFVDSSVDESKLLLWAGSDTDPGRYYLFDKTSKALSELMLARPELERATLAPVKAAA